VIAMADRGVAAVRTVLVIVILVAVDVFTHMAGKPAWLRSHRQVTSGPSRSCRTGLGARPLVLWSPAPKLER
jgi:hypothetical protein